MSKGAESISSYLKENNQAGAGAVLNVADSSSIEALFEMIKERMRLCHMKFGALNAWVIAGFLGLAVYFTFSMEKMVTFSEQGTYEFGMYLPALALIFNLLANRFIRKDEALIRSVDRIR